MIKLSFVFKKQVKKNGCHIRKPQQVGHNEVFDKRYHVIQRYVDYVVWLIGPAFQPEKPGQINQCVK